MPIPAQTTGIGVDVALTLDTDPSHAVTLSLSGTNTHQLTPGLKDAAGTVQSATQSFTYISRNPGVATVSGTGLITTVAKGGTVIEAAYPALNNLRGNGPDGLPVAKIFNEVNVSVTL